MIILDLPTGGAYMPWHPPIAHSLFYIYKEKTIGLATGLHRLEKSARINQVACNGIEHAVDIATTLRSGIDIDTDTKKVDVEIARGVVITVDKHYVVVLDGKNLRTLGELLVDLLLNVCRRDGSRSLAVGVGREIKEQWAEGRIGQISRYHITLVAHGEADHTVRLVGNHDVSMLSIPKGLT